MPDSAAAPIGRYRWAAAGDVNAFFGLMLDNIAGLVLAVGLLEQTFEFPVEFALGHMVPGTAIGVFVGDFLFTLMALRVARRTGRRDLTAMPLGLDTPSTFGMVFFVLGPAFLHAKNDLGLPKMAAAEYAWHIGICAIFISGVFKFACSLGAGWMRRMVPRAGLLGSLAAIALVLISFLPLVEIARYPVAGFAALAVILTTLVARVAAPGRIPGALAAILVGGAVYYAMQLTGTLGPVSAATIEPVWLPTDWLDAFSFQWTWALGDSLSYLPIVIPFAFATVIGGIDCTESAAAAGDEFDTRQVIAVESLATLVAALCGGVIQTTPYIGQPAYKAMGGRAGYTLATALFVGGAGFFGYFALFYAILPKAVAFPILVFIGLEISAQSFHATPRQHYAAVVLGCLPAMAALVMLHVDNLLGVTGLSIAKIAALESHQAKSLADSLQTLRVLSGGFIVTSMLWASALAALIDRRLPRAAGYLAVAGLCSLFGVIHSPLSDSALLVPWSETALAASSAGQTPWHIATAYGTMALLLVVWPTKGSGVFFRPPGNGIK